MLSRERHKELFVAACEGGISYWGEVLDYDPSKCTASVWEEVSLDTTTSSYHDLDLEVIARGVERLRVSEYPWHYADIITSNDDAATADAVVQMGLFGDIHYG